MGINVSQEIILPGRTDLHVHARDFAQAYKETFTTCTQAALASGVDTIGAMPNYEPEFEVRPYNLRNMLALQATARGRIYSDVGMWAAAQPQHDNIGELEHIMPLSIGAKFYIEPTQGNDTQYDVRSFIPIARRIHEVAPDKLIAAHAEDDTIEDAIGYIAGDIGQRLYIPHVNNRFVLDAIRKAKSNGLPVYAEVCPHHLFMTEEDSTSIGWRARMKPVLGPQEGLDYLWAHIDDFDTIGTDHAPHTLEEKDRADRENPDARTEKEYYKSYGVPGLDTTLPLMLYEIIHGYAGKPRLTFDQFVQKTFTNPRRLIGLPVTAETSVRVDTGTYELEDDHVYSKCGWTPFAGRVVCGTVVEVRRDGETLFTRDAQSPNGRFMEPPAGRILYDAGEQAIV